MNENTFGIAYKDGKIEKLTGKTIAQAYAKNGKKTKEGNIDFSILDFFFLVPVPQENLTDEYTILLKRDKKSPWEFVKETYTRFSAAEDVMKLKVKLEGYFTGVVVDLSNDKILSWIWSR